MSLRGFVTVQPRRHLMVKRTLCLYSPHSPPDMFQPGPTRLSMFPKFLLRKSPPHFPPKRVDPVLSWKIILLVAQGRRYKDDLDDDNIRDM
jgi:hypothetical protein